MQSSHYPWPFAHSITCGRYVCKRDMSRALQSRPKPRPKPMKSARKYTPEQWAEARRLRAEGLTFARIAEHLGFAVPRTVAARALKEGWPSPRSAAASPAKRARSRPTAAPAVARKPPSPASLRTCRALAMRLYGVFELEIRMKELSMKKRLKSYRQAGHDAEPPVVTTQERESFAALIQQINQVTEMASEPALAADGRRKFATLNPELTALSDEPDADALGAASQKDELRREIADELEKLGPPPASA